MNSVTVRELLPQTNHALAAGTNDTYTRALIGGHAKNTSI
jgi:hypothetical protein